MTSNKNRDLAKKALVETTGKNETIFHAVSICPVLQKSKVVFKIMKIGFTIDGKSVSIEEIDSATNEATALGKFQIHSTDCGMDLKALRQMVRDLKNTIIKDDNEENKGIVE